MLCTYLDCSQIYLYFRYNSGASSSLQYPMLLRTISSLWCGSIILPGRGSTDFSTGSWEYPFWKCGLPMFDLFCVSSEPMCSKLPVYRVHRSVTIVKGPFFLDSFQLELIWKILEIDKATTESLLSFIPANSTKQFKNATLTDSWISGSCAYTSSDLVDSLCNERSILEEGSNHEKIPNNVPCFSRKCSWHMILVIFFINISNNDLGVHMQVKVYVMCK